MVDDDYDTDELMWVKAGEPGEKPTIIRQIRSESSSSGSRDNSGGSSCGGHNPRNLLTVENGTVYRNGVINSTESIETLEKIARISSNESRVIVVNVQDPIYPVNIDRQRIQKWKELHSPRATKKQPANNTKDKNSKNGKLTNNNTIERSRFNNQPKVALQRRLSQPTQTLLSTTNPSLGTSQRCSSLDPKNSSLTRVAKTRDEGYTSLTEDCKDSDTDSVRSKSLPSTWKPINNGTEKEGLKRYAQHMTSNNATDCSYLYHADGDELLADTDETLLDTEAYRDLKKRKQRSKLRNNIESSIETYTCFACLRGAVYHAEDEDDTDSLVDHPCACDKPGVKCFGRWALISAMVCFLPFLLCYPPLKGCLNVYDRRKKLADEKSKNKKLSDKNEKKLCKKQNSPESFSSSKTKKTSKN